MHSSTYFVKLLQTFQNAEENKLAFSVYNGTDQKDISYRRFYEDILSAAGYFRDNSICNRHIALLGPNSYEWIVTFFAIAITGNTAVLANPDLPIAVLREQFEFADVSAVCYDQNYMKISAEQSVTWIPFNALQSDSSMELSAVYPWDAEETLAMMFTSGTTGSSKVVEYSFANLQGYLSDLAEIINDDYDRVLLVAPLHHIMGLTSVFARFFKLFCVCIGRGVRYMIWDIPVLNPSILQMVPSVLESIVKLLKNAKTEQAQQKYIGKNLKRISVGGANSNKELCRFMMQLGIIVETGYGMTESMGAGTWCQWDADNMSTIGKPYGNVQMRVKDGELQIRSVSVMKGYYKDPEETAKVIVDGWLHTGDMGYCDEDGYYYITGRKKNVIILSNGENVNPEEIEATFGACQAIEECLVYSDGKGICADVFTKEQDAAAAFIKTYNESMPMYRQVYKVNYTEEPLPKTGSGKIKRKENK